MEQQLPLFARELALADQQTVWKALSLLEYQLRETGASFTSSHAVRDWLRLQLASLEREEFTALFLDNQHDSPRNAIYRHHQPYAGPSPRSGEGRSEA